MRRKKKLLAILLCVSMVVGWLPANARAEGNGHKHCMCAGQLRSSHTGHDENMTWIGISSLDEIQQNGNYYLTDNVERSTTWECRFNVNLCLNGKTISCNAGTYRAPIAVIYVDKAAMLTITDCFEDGNPNGEKGGKITHGSGYLGRGIQNEGQLSLYNGAIIGNNNESAGFCGGGVSNEAGAIFDMYGGWITKNQDVNGAGVYNAATSDAYAVFHMYGGTMNLNKASNLGGAVFNAGNDQQKAQFSLLGGNIGDDSTRGNNASEGGGVYNEGEFEMRSGTVAGNLYAGVKNVEGATFTMYGGTISENSISGVDNSGTRKKPHGGSGGTFIMEAGTITLNTAVAGGGVCNYGEFRMNGGSIVSNFATNGAGGVYNYGTFTMAANSQATISKNAARAGGGVSNFKTFNMYGGFITDNVVEKGSSSFDHDGAGGGIYNYQGTITMSGGSITGNYADNKGGAVYSFGGGTLNLSGTVKIAGNKGGNVYLDEDEKITVTDALDATSRVGVSSVDTNAGKTVVANSTNTTIFTSDSTGYILEDNGENGLLLYLKEKATQPVPDGLNGVQISAAGASDGKISGVTEAMEYRKVGDIDWITCQGDEITGLAAGTYEVRYKETASKKASDPILITVSAVEPPAPNYQIIEGANGAWTQNTDGTLTFRANGDFSKFAGVKVDGNLIAADKYTAVAGSTVITLKQDYLASLSVGAHTLTVVYTDGACSTTFAIQAAAAHTHSYGTEWKYDGTNHWHACACGDKADNAAHVLTWVVDRKATVEQKGAMHQECTVCGFRQNENTEIAKLKEESSSKETTEEATKRDNSKDSSSESSNTKDSTKSSNTKTNSSKADATSPKTGDDSDLFTRIALLFLSGGAMAGIAVMDKKRYNR